MSKVQGPRSKVQGPRSEVQGPKSKGASPGLGQPLSDPPVHNPEMITPIPIQQPSWLIYAAQARKQLDNVKPTIPGLRINYGATRDDARRTLPSSAPGTPPLGKKGTRVRCVIGSTCWGGWDKGGFEMVHRSFRILFPAEAFSLDLGSRYLFCLGFSQQNIFEIRKKIFGPVQEHSKTDEFLRPSQSIH